MPVILNLSPKPAPAPFQHSGGSFNTWQKFDTTLAEGVGYPTKNTWFVGVYDGVGVRQVQVCKRTDNDAFSGGITVWDQPVFGSVAPSKVGKTFTWWRWFFAMEQLPPMPLAQDQLKAKATAKDTSKVLEAIKAMSPGHHGFDVAKTLVFEQDLDASVGWSQLVHTPAPDPVMVKFVVSLQQGKNYWPGKTIALPEGGFVVVGIEKNPELNTFEIAAKKVHA